MRFTQKLGLSPIKTELEKTGMSPELRNSLWTVVIETILEFRSNERGYNNYGQREAYSKLAEYFRDLWIDFFKMPIDNLSISYGCIYGNSPFEFVRAWFYKATWGEVFDFIEFSSSYHDSFAEICNNFLKRELSAFRFVDGQLVEINSKEEVVEIQNAIRNADKFKSVKTHIQTALELLSDRKNPDYRNSIKESISAVESLAKIIIKDDKTTLGQALKEIEKKHQIPNSLKSAFSALYGYTSDEGGIRHSLLENNVNVGMEEARFMLITCSAFVNYLMNKI
ncbi:AbiJ-NTD4 domain-containing protein [Flavobacterium ovatum]|uniref:AbiJ-NTD4 domain-containing protein n=1 Tax=Flavobacterium ovatum TaxID=1928857 RepID=UPI00344E49A4